MDAKRLELYELLKPKLDEEPARALVLALPPGADDLATKDDLRRLEERIDTRSEAHDARMDIRFAQLDTRFAQMEATLTRRMVTIMGAWTILVGSTVGWVAVLFN